MPYGAIGVRCLACGKELYFGSPYCPQCGVAQPEPPLESFQTAIEDLPRIQAALRSALDHSARFWSYSVSHEEAEVRIDTAPGHNMLLKCGATRYVQADTGGLHDVRAEIVGDHVGRAILVSARGGLGLEVRCRTLVLYYDVPPLY